MTEKEQPLFDSVHEALSFALNANDIQMPRPYMNKAMAEAPSKKFSKKVKKAHDIRDAEIRRMQLYPRAHFKGMEKAAQAGFILAKLDTLAPEQSTVLKGLLTRAYDPCSCGQPCCCGQRPNPRWSVAVKQMCEILKETGDVLAIPGKRGLSTQPNLRLLIVETWFTGARVSLASIATRVGVSPITAKAHHDWIVTYLEQAETEAWLNIAPILDQAGITGAIL